MMRIFNKLGTAVIAALLLVGVVSGANAATYEWNFANTAGLPTHSFSEVSASCSGAGCGSTPTASITMRAYSAANSTTATWSVANFTNQGGSGLGIAHSGEPSGSPDHAIDSITNTDYVVIDAGVGNVIDWASLSIGWGWEADSSGGNSTCRSNGNCTPEIKFWSSNTLPGTLTGNNLGSSNGSASYTGGAAAANIPGTITSSRYLVMAGDINDAFKLKTIAGTTVQVPEPASIALLALGLLGFGFSRRKHTA